MAFRHHALVLLTAIGAFSGDPAYAISDFCASGGTTFSHFNNGPGARNFAEPLTLEAGETIIVDARNSPTTPTVFRAVYDSTDFFITALNGSLTVPTGRSALLRWQIGGDVFGDYAIEVICIPSGITNPDPDPAPDPEPDPVPNPEPEPDNSATTQAEAAGETAEFIAEASPFGGGFDKFGGRLLESLTYEDPGTEFVSQILQNPDYGKLLSRLGAAQDKLDALPKQPAATEEAEIQRQYDVKKQAVEVDEIKNAIKIIFEKELVQFRREIDDISEHIRRNNDMPAREYEEWDEKRSIIEEKYRGLQDGYYETKRKLGINDAPSRAPRDPLAPRSVRDEVQGIVPLSYQPENRTDQQAMEAFLYQPLAINGSDNTFNVSFDLDRLAYGIQSKDKRFEFWLDGGFTLLTDHSIANREGESGYLSFGGSWRAAQNLVIGAEVTGMAGHFDINSINSKNKFSGLGANVGLAYRIAPSLTAHLIGFFNHADVGSNLSGVTGSYGVDQFGLAAGLSGVFERGGIRFRPRLTAGWTATDVNGYTDSTGAFVAGQDSDHAQVAASLRIEKRIFGSGSLIAFTPFVEPGFTHRFDTRNVVTLAPGITVNDSTTRATLAFGSGFEFVNGMRFDLSGRITHGFDGGITGYGGSARLAHSF